VLENPDPTLDDGLRAAGMEVVRIPRSPDRAGLLDLLAKHRPQLLFKRSRLVVDAEVLDHARDLFAVMLCCIGDDSVDKMAAADRGVLVMNDPRSNGRSVAEMVIGELLVGARRLPEAWELTRRHGWDKSSAGRYELKGKTLGILGLGNIGKQVARLAETLGMKLLFHDNDEVAQAVGETMDWAAARDIGELFAQSDVLSDHVTAEDVRGRSNHGLVKREHLMALGEARGDTSPRIFLNLARGLVLDPEDLIAAVRAGRVRQAFVDVFPEEPHGNDGWNNPFAGVPQVHATPHIGAATEDAQPRIARKMAQTARLLSAQATVEDCVFAPKHRIEVANTAESPHILAVVHSDERGTKKAVDDAIFRAGVSNLQSAHRDFPRFGIAYDVSVIERPLTESQVEFLVAEATQLTSRPDAIRAVRQVSLEG
jgi:D-3-phosphoglycerate dehydrogenase